MMKLLMSGDSLPDDGLKILVTTRWWDFFTTDNKERRTCVLSVRARTQ